MQSEGISAGIIVDSVKADKIIANAIYNLEKATKKDIKEVLVSFSGSHVKSFYLTYTIKIDHKIVNQKDIKTLVDKAIQNFQVANYDVIGVYPIDFIIDDLQKIQNPIGMVAKKLTSNIHIVASESTSLVNFVNCFAKYQIAITKFIPNAIALGYSCLTKDERHRGSIVLDLGAKTTSIGIFINSKPLYTSCIGMGGWHITNDIATVFSIDIATAEKLKVLYGYVSLSNNAQDSLIDLEDISPEGNFDNNHLVSTATLAQVIKARLSEMLTLIQAEYTKAGIDYLMNGKIILTGGSSAMRGAKELTATIFRKQVRIAKPELLDNMKIEGDINIYSSAIGAVRYYIAKINELASLQQSKFLHKVFRWLKENI
jgi:cell division protein FtsA